MRGLAVAVGTVVAFATVLSLGCTISKPQTPLRELNEPFTLRPVGMDSTEFVRAADELIARVAPAYRHHNAEVHLGFGLVKKYGVTDQRADGSLYIILGRPALVMATVEDLAAVLLHEYAHVVYWDYVFDNPSFEGATLECKKARAEMIANKVVIELYRRLKYRHDMLTHAVSLYQRHRTKAIVMECPAEITIDMPKWVVPRRLQGKHVVVPTQDLPEYLEESNEEYLNPWEDPNKTDPLYPSSQRPKPFGTSDAP